MMPLVLFQITVMSRKNGVPSFADIIKIEITFLKLIFKNSIKVKKITNYKLKFSFYVNFPIEQELLISGENADVSRIEVVSHVIYLFFVSSVFTS